MSERLIQANGVELATEAFGDPADAPVLLVMGVMASMLWWPEEFCRRLAANRRYVIRYDNRDTGHSTTYEPGAPAYTFDDMVEDTFRVLDGYGLLSAHLVGMSMGGYIAQLAALKHPARAATLTVISTSPTGEDTSDLPASTPAYAKHSERFAGVDWSDRAQAVAYLVEDSRQLAGPAHPFDEAATTTFIERDYDRAHNFASVVNHTQLPSDDGPPLRISDLRPPLLVIHGTADPIFPIEHALAFTAAVPDATLLRLEGSGHELHEADWPAIIAAITAHTTPNGAR
jgi:pimeloyl-ACP methyl ester carboxylesterase